LISGGHTHIFKVDGCYNFYLLGKTIDDAAGETFDKIARFANLSYPGGPEIEKLAREGDENSVTFPVALRNTMDFSFSGLKTNVINTIAGKKYTMGDICASFQKTVAITFSEKINEALRQTPLDTVIISGGVACNNYLRERLPSMINAKVFFPSKKLCTDNGDMVAYAAYRLNRKKAFLGFDKTAADSLEI
jgi:N6-L-threonylcarbamoyladenine synthase